MGVWHNLWRHKLTILLGMYFLVEAISLAFQLPLDRASWYYRTFVIIVILAVLWQFRTIAQANKVPT